MSEEKIQAVDGAASLGDEETGTDIRDTDIVFDCPHCGHNLAIDYRGAGLQITCVNCGESVLVPIPDGMKIDDLDIEPGEILKQLFAARRNLQKIERKLEEREAELDQMRAQRDSLQALLEYFKVQVGELKASAHALAEHQERTAKLTDELAKGFADAVRSAEGGASGEKVAPL